MANRLTNAFWRSIGLAIVGSLTLLAISSAYASDAVRLKAKYIVSLSGLKVGDLRFVGTVGRDGYDVKGTGELAGLPHIFMTFKGETESAGAFDDGAVDPARHSARYNTIKKDYVTRMAFVDGSVTSLDLQPPKKQKRSRVPILDEHKVDVIDPVAAAILPGPQSGALMTQDACNRTLPIFDGRERFDMRLAFKGFGQVEAKREGSYSGPVIICSVHYTPISGHRIDDNLVEEWSATGAIEVWFAPVAVANALVLYRIKLPTPLGTAVIHPKAFRFDSVGPQG